MATLPKEWREFLDDNDMIQKMDAFLDKVYENEKKVYPPREKVFEAFTLCSPSQIKVVICGQDPYHGANQAMGLAFSVNRENTVPPSLRNVYKELESDISDFKRPKHGDLTKWANHVFLLNSALTVQHKSPGSHMKEWRHFTRYVLHKINKNCKNVVFMAWGNFAKGILHDIDYKRHLVLQTSHPSPLSAQRGFIGCKHFSNCNDYLEKNGQTKIDWQN